MKNKILWFVLISLLLIWGLSTWLSGNRDKNFDAEIIHIDTATVTEIQIRPKGDSAEISLKKEAGLWIATKGNTSIKALPKSVSVILDQLINVRASGIVALDETKWDEYEVSDSAGIQVRIFEKDRLTEELIIGNFHFDPQGRSATSYVRLAKGKAVYAVQGFLSMAFSQGFDAFRDKTILSISPESVESFEYRSIPDSLTLVFSKSADGNWLLNDSLVADSGEIEIYLSTVSNVAGTEFSEEPDPLQLKSLQHKSLIFHVENASEPIVIQCLTGANVVGNFTIYSNQNPQTYFASDSAGLYKRLFPEWQGWFSARSEK